MEPELVLLDSEEYQAHQKLNPALNIQCGLPNNKSSGDIFYDAPRKPIRAEEVKI